MEFSLIQLPDVPKIEIIHLMTIGERIKLAISSRRMENYLSRLFKKPDEDSDYRMSLQGEESYIDIQRGEWRLFMSPLRLNYEEPNDISDEDIKPWLDEKCTMIENTLNVFSRLQNVFPCDTTNLSVILNKIEPTPISNILSYPCVANLTGVHFYGGGTMQRHEMDAIMEWRRENTEQFISVTENKIPLDYKHPNALRFSGGVVYGDARWIRLEDLLSMRNVIRPVLGDNNFSMKDLNTFIRYWINCEENMFTYLNIEYKQFNSSDFLKDITILKGFRTEKPFYLIASNSTENQLLTMQLISFPNNPKRQKELDFSVQHANKPHQFVRGGTAPAWTREYRILRLLARKRSLEEMGITVGGAGEEEKELGDLEEELAAEGVQMIDGIMTVQEKL
uniref:FBA_2 domain-containing protein n=1 Tax=Caenorhabditis tropicalis TaxID=1561998 RepID=A0A1I7UF65_9PELO